MLVWTRNCANLSDTAKIWNRSRSRIKSYLPEQRKGDGAEGHCPSPLLERAAPYTVVKSESNPLSEYVGLLNMKRGFHGEPALKKQYKN